MKINRKGEEMVEAALVLPVVILTIISMLMLMVYFFSCLNNQVSLHSELIAKQCEEETVLKTIKNTTETSDRTGGLVSVLMHRKTEGRVYALRESRLIRTGEIINGFKT